MADENIRNNWPSAPMVHKDPVRGATVWQLTNYRAHRNHEYFTCRWRYAQGRKLDLIVSDNDAQNPYRSAWRFADGAFEGPQVLAGHRGSVHTQAVHVHSWVHINKTTVLHAADAQGCRQVFIVDLPAWGALPDRSAVGERKEV